MYRSAKILSLNNLPKILIKEDTGKLKTVELDCIKLNANNKIDTYLYLRQSLNKPIELYGQKNADVCKITESGKDLAIELLRRGFARLNNNQDSKCYSREEVNKLALMVSEPQKKADANTYAQLYHKSYKGSVDILNQQLILVNNTCPSIKLKHIETFFEVADIDVLAQFILDNCNNIDIIVEYPYYDVISRMDVTEIILPFQVEKEILSQGWGSLRPEAQLMLSHQQFTDLQTSSDIAKSKFKGIWKSFFDSFLEKIYDTPVEAKVAKVIEGHRYILKMNDSFITVELSRIVCPTHQENGAYQCRQFARRELVGRKFLVLLEKSKIVTGQHRVILIRQQDIILVDQLLIQKGLATVRTSTSFRSDPHRELFLELQKKNKEDKIGIYTNDFNIFRFQDLTRLENKIEKASARQFADRVLTQNPAPILSVVQGIKDAARIIVRMPFYRAMIVVKLDGVRTLSVNSKQKAVETFKKASLQFCEDRFLQKDVQVILSHFDQDKGFSGNIFINKKNIVQQLLAEGFIRITDQTQYGKLKFIQDQAKQQVKNIWVPQLQEFMTVKSKQKTYQEFKAVISHVEHGSVIFYQKTEDLDKIDQIAAQLENQLKPLVKGQTYSLMYYAAPFEGAFYRATVGQVFKNNAATIVEVEYLDYGNRAKVKTSQLMELPSTPIMQNKALAHRIDIQFAESIQGGGEMSQNALQAISAQLNGQTFFIQRRIFESDSPRRSYEVALLYQDDKNRHIFVSKNFQLIASGLLKIDIDQLQFLNSQQYIKHLLQLEKQARQKGLYLWYDNNEDQFDKDQCMKMKGFNSYMNSNY